MNGKPLSKLQDSIGYHFKDTSLLHCAMTHSSYGNESHSGVSENNERLEFLGDAVLELVTSDYLYAHYPDQDEGKMTKLRASIVCEPTLAMSARVFSLSSYLLMGRGEDLAGGRDRDSITSDAMEALIGAIYLDGGLPSAREFIDRFVLNDIERKHLFSDSKTILQERVRQFCEEPLCYEIVREEGPEHDKRFFAEVSLSGKVLGSGSGRTKKAAHQMAAYEALLKLEENREEQDAVKED